MHVELCWATKATKKLTSPLNEVGIYFTLRISILSRSIDAIFNLDHFARFVSLNALTTFKPNDDNARYKRKRCDDAHDASYYSMFCCHSLYVSWYPNFDGGSLDLVVWVPQSPLGRYHVRYFQGTSGLLASSIV
jgi:hypothetical protein